MAYTAREIASFGICLTFLIFFLSSGVVETTRTHVDALSETLKSTVEFPDFSKYRSLRTLESREFPIDSDKGRVVVVGDIHGMSQSLEKLLKSLAFNTKTDTLIHVGDILAKGPHEGSMKVLDYMTTHNITGVRGNHDQKVIDWKTWLEWIQALPGGSAWLTQTSAKWENAESSGVELERWLSHEAKRTHDKKWWKRVPKGWVLFGEHYRVAKAMSKEQADYMLALPLLLHIPSAHAFIAHAGVLSSDPTKKPEDASQPLAHAPYLPTRTDKDRDVEALRTIQELAMLKEIPLNENPWVTLNMRGVKGSEITRDKDGRPWSDLWNDDMTRCGGFDATFGRHKKSPLPCLPVTVIYGHAASRGLDLKRWSLGIDSGCVYERKLSAVVLGSSPHKLQLEDEEDEEDTNENGLESRKTKSISFGEHVKGRVFSVKCKH